MEEELKEQTSTDEQETSLDENLQGEEGEVIETPEEGNLEEENQEEEKKVPLKAVISERKKRQALEQELEEMKRQMQELQNLKLNPPIQQQQPQDPLREAIEPYIREREQQVLGRILDMEDKLRFMHKYPSVDIDTIDKAREEFWRKEGIVYPRETVYAKLRLQELESGKVQTETAKQMQREMNRTAKVQTSSATNRKEPPPVDTMSKDELKEMLKNQKF